MFHEKDELEIFPRSSVSTRDATVMNETVAYFGQIGTSVERQLTRVVAGLLVRRLAFVAYLEDLAIGHGVVETRQDGLVAEDRPRAFGVSLTNGMADSFGRWSLFLVLDPADGFNQPFLPYCLAARPRVGLPSLAHSSAIENTD